VPIIVSDRGDWVDLRDIRIDVEDATLGELSDEEQEDVYRELTAYARTGIGGTVAMRARGSREYDVLRVGRLEIDVTVDRDGRTLIVDGIAVASDESDDD
jgi:hypothetical protein